MASSPRNTRTDGWKAEPSLAADSIADLAKSGFHYSPAYGDPPDVEALTQFKAELKSHAKFCPLLNGNWKTVAAGALHLMTTSNRFPRTPRSLRDRKTKADDFATMVRNATFHIRREWYRKSTKEWMSNFPRPSEQG